MNKNFYNKLLENHYSRDLDDIEKDLDTYWTLCIRYQQLVNMIHRAGFYYDEQNNIFDIVELFAALHLKESGINTDHIVDKIIEK